MHRSLPADRSLPWLFGPATLALALGMVIVLGGSGGRGGTGEVAGSAVPAPRTTAPPGAVVLVGAGDIADCGLDGDEATARLLDGIDGTVFTAGDNAYENGSRADFERCYGPTWGRHRERTLPVIGNHEWQTRGAEGYHAYFGQRTGGAGSAWYAMTLGGWRIIVLDSDCAEAGGCGPDSPQGRWLADEFARNAARCTLAIWHHPRFSSGPHGDDGAVDPLWRAMYGAGVELVINGHEHSYERFAPQDGDGRSDPARGVREFVVGTGGRDLRELKDPKPNSELGEDRTFGVLRLVLRPDDFDWAFMPIAGQTFTDTGSGVCR